MNLLNAIRNCESNVQLNFDRNSELETELNTIKEKLSTTTNNLKEAERKIAEITGQAQLRKGLTPSRISQPSIPIMKRFGKKNNEAQKAAADALAARREQLRKYQDADPQLRKRNKARDDAFGIRNASYSKSPVAKRIQRMWKTPSAAKAKRDAYRRNKESFNNNQVWPDESS